MTPKTKVCSRCKLEKSLDEFYQQKDGKFGRRSECKKCILEKTHIYYENNKEYCLEKSRKYYSENRNHHKELTYNWRYKNTNTMPMHKATYSSDYLGIYIAEQILSKVFKNVTRMPNNNPGYDFICSNGYKIDVKSRCLTPRKNRSSVWRFCTRYNKIADYFLCLAFDNRSDLNIKHLWLIKNDELRQSKSDITITESKIDKWKEFEQPIDKVIACMKEII